MLGYPGRDPEGVATPSASTQPNQLSFVKLKQFLFVWFYFIMIYNVLKDQQKSKQLVFLKFWFVLKQFLKQNEQSIPETNQIKKK